MKKMISIFTKYAVIILFLIFIIVSQLFDYNPGKEITVNFIDFTGEMLAFIPFLFILIGLFDVWIPTEKIQKHIGVNSGYKGTILIIFLAMFQAGPLYGAFPVASMLWKKGCSIKNIFIYLGAFSTLKIPMLSFEIGFLGIKFTLLRTIITLPIFIIISEIITLYLKDKKFEINDDCI